MSNSAYRVIAIAAVIGVITAFSVMRSSKRQAAAREAAVESAGELAAAIDTSKAMSMADVIARARAVRQAMSESLNDYTATFIKQERQSSGLLSEVTAMQMKVQTRFRDGVDSLADSGEVDLAPMRVFLRFTSPVSQAGRKVIWGQDLYDGKMAVHEVGMLLGLKTIWLDPNGMIAMQGQKHPISEIGMVKLVEKLIERGQQDLDTPGMEITLSEDHDFGGIKTEVLRISRSVPTGDENGFSLAEIILDPERQLILQYRSLGWPEKAGDPAPLLESYTYENVQTNVGLTDADFDVNNPDYGYPAF